LPITEDGARFATDICLAKIQQPSLSIVTLNNADHVKKLNNADVCRANEIIQKMQVAFLVGRCLVGRLWRQYEAQP
jgi:hypothetical protein